ncbi:phosphorothioated DNA-binding restriction endonuclease [Nocardiopsis tropica]|uniref:Phosphorothioated DNA-binding restriction endonuclease n=1 Tax=Nocardiopsis tropica TaxID=109330 RepID=A0ABV1ZUA2_9ACTN|nr:HNH endonuclease [Nocardiopsis tropica]
MDWLDRFDRIRRWQRGGVRAPHKPLLLLYALGHHQRHGDAPISYSEAEAHLARLLREFGPPGRTTPAYPFHHLTGDGLWTVTTVDGGGSPGASPRQLREKEAMGRLAPELVEDLAHDPGLVPRLALHLLDTGFPPSLHQEILTGTGLRLGTLAAEQPGPGGARDPKFRDLVLTAYEHRCAFCGYEGLVDRVSVGLEAAHVRWWAYRGPNSLDNGLCLCSLHHLLFDRGVVGLTADLNVTVSSRFEARSPEAGRLVHALAGRPALRPGDGSPTVAPEHIAWHVDQVFRAPAREDAAPG